MSVATGKLRVGLLLDSFTDSAWVARIVDDVRGSSFAELALVVVNSAATRKGGWSQLVSQRDLFLWRAYKAVDGRMFRSEPDPFRRVDLAPLLAGVPVLQVQPHMKRFSDYFPPAAVEAIGNHKLDVAFRFGFRILRGEALQIARYGVWSFHHGDNRVNRGGPPCFWEVANGEPVTGSVLQVLTPDLDAGRVLYRSWSATHLYSLRANQARTYAKAASFAIRTLRDLHQHGASALCEPGEPGTYQPYSEPLYRPPTNRKMVPILIRLVGRMASAAARNFVSRGSWFVAYKAGEPGRLPGHFFDFKLLVPPRGRIWADPFAVVHDGRRCIFLEEQEHGAKGHISMIEILPDGSQAAPVIVLDRPYHLSYPFVFRWNGGLYMVPETRGNRTVELYRCSRFPDEWKLERVLLEDVAAVDATLHEVDGTWWMWLDMAEPGASMLDEVHLFHADSPLGPWTPHSRNPVKSDVRSARPAGGLFRWQGELLRPAQDGSRLYGYAVTFNRVVRLTPDEYKEEELSKLLPHWREGVLGTHTFNHDGGLTVIDGFHYRRRFL